jgi:hypothetical protein
MHSYFAIMANQKDPLLFNFAENLVSMAEFKLIQTMMIVNLFKNLSRSLVQY